MAKITEKTLLPKALADMVIKEVNKLSDKGYSANKAIKLGTQAAVNKWREKNADKSRG